MNLQGVSQTELSQCRPDGSYILTQGLDPLLLNPTHSDLIIEGLATADPPVQIITLPKASSHTVDKGAASQMP